MNVRINIRAQYIRIFEYSNIFVTLWCGVWIQCSAIDAGGQGGEGGWHDRSRWDTALVLEKVDVPSTSLLDCRWCNCWSSPCSLCSWPAPPGRSKVAASLYPEEEEWDERRTNTRKIRFRWGQEEAAEVIQHVGAFQCWVKQAVEANILTAPWDESFLDNNCNSLLSHYVWPHSGPQTQLVGGEAPTFVECITP